MNFHRFGHDPVAMRRRAWSAIDFNSFEAMPSIPPDARPRVGDYAFNCGPDEVADRLAAHDLTIAVVVPMPVGKYGPYPAVSIFNDCEVVYCPVNKPGDDRWTFDGNVDAPTIHPSIGVPDGWHGFVRGGEMTEA